MAQCEKLTKRKEPCPIDADRVRAGHWYCHVHDPEGTFALQKEARKAERIATRKARVPRQPRPPRDRSWLAVPPIRF